MSNPKRKRRNRHRARKHNPMLSSGRRHFSSRKAHRRRNPAIAGYQAMDVVTIGAGAAAGAIAARGLTQMVLKDKNTGVLGYLANIAAALGLSYLTKKFINERASVGVLAGGLGGVMIRIWSEKVSQTSPNPLAGLGDLDFSDDGLGEYVNTSFSLPTVSRLTNGNYLNVDPFPAGSSSAPGQYVSQGGTVMPIARFTSRFAANPAMPSYESPS